MENYKFTHNWILWYHHEKDNWDISGYKNIYKINNPETFWSWYNNWELFGGLLSKQFFLMKENIEPRWEDINNISGGCWSLKIDSSECNRFWERLSSLLVLDKISNIKNDINGISICLKKNNNCVIKIWNKDKKNDKINCLNQEIFKELSPEIYYIANVTS